MSDLLPPAVRTCFLPNESALRSLCSLGRFRLCLQSPSRLTFTSCSPPFPWGSSQTFPKPFVEGSDRTSSTSADPTGPRSNAKQSTDSPIMLQGQGRTLIHTTPSTLYPQTSRGTINKKDLKGNTANQCTSALRRLQLPWKPNVW